MTNTVIKEIKQLAKFADADVLMMGTNGNFIAYRLPADSSEMRLFLKEIISAEWKNDKNDEELITRKFEVFLMNQGFEMEECSITFYVRFYAAS